MRKKFVSRALAMAMAAVMMTTVVPANVVSAGTTSSEESQREKDNAALSRKVAAQGMVLLENQNSVLPLKAGKVALFGPGAEQPVKGGTGSGDVNQRYVVSVTEGLKNAGFTITSTSFLERWNEAYEKGLAESNSGSGASSLMSGSYMHPDEKITSAELKEAKEGTDTAVYVLTRRSGEGSDRTDTKGDYELSDTERANLEALNKNFKNVVVVLNTGGVIDTSFMEEIDGLDSLLLMSDPGMEAGNALADVLTGKVTPSGKLTDTWAQEYSDYPSAGTFASEDDDSLTEVYEDGIYVGYRYFDSFDVTPEYEFGYGQSYTDFDIKVNSVTADKSNVKVNVTVTNTGKTYSGKEVVQVYFSAPDGDIEKPYQELAAYAKTDDLAPGEKQTLTISYKTTEMSSYSEAKSAYIMEDGKYIIRVGNSSRNTTAAAVITLNKNVVTEQLSTQAEPEEAIDELSRAGKDSYESPTEAADLKTAIKITLNGNTIKKVNKSIDSEEEDAVTTYTTDENYTATKDYETVETVKSSSSTIKLRDVVNGKATLKEFVAQMSVDELSTLVEGIGFENFFGSSEPIVGAQSDTVDGAAGETTSDFKSETDSYGIPNIVLADGPAGIRISQSYEYVDTDGSTQTMYQYCTAWPIGTLLAQTWDVDLIQQVGEAVGQEMVEMGVTLWLAPGMNIHRNPLCGRNFEYFSEDPLVTGLTAAAETNGVQSNPGVGVTIKHYAANNQETNRSTSNSIISERALREIYLKGFEIVVKSAQPMAIMTSYNKVNGTHSSNNKDIIDNIARKEWGFEGLVMTDWFSRGTDYDAMHAGNDLIMPGGNGKVIAQAVKDGKIALGDVQKSAMNVLNIIMKSYQMSSLMGDGTAASGQKAAAYSSYFDNLTTFVSSIKDKIVAAPSVSFKTAAKSLVAGETYTQKATVANTDSTATYKSSNTKVATVDKNGKVTAKAAGTATITATVDGKSATYKVTVNDVTASFETTEKSVVLGKTYTQAVTTNSKSTVAYKSSNTKVATVDKNGKVTAKAAGTATITATVAGKSATYNVTVVPANVSVKKVTSTSRRKATVTFNTVSGASKYTVVVSTDKNFKNAQTATVTAKTGTTQSVTVTNLTSKKTYYVKVYAVSSAKTNGESSNTKTVTVR
jgi:beta-glucosidase